MSKYNIKGQRFLRKYTEEETSPVYAAAIQAQAIVDKFCTIPWNRTGVDAARLSYHTEEIVDEERKLSGLEMNVEIRDSFDAALFCAGHKSGMHRAYANVAIYRYMMPESAIGKTLTSLSARVTSDPYNSEGARLHVFTNSTGEIPMNCRVLRGENESGEIIDDGTTAAGVAKRTEKLVGKETLWYPTTETCTLRPSALTLQKYLFVLVALESYSTVRGNWMEGCSFIANSVEIETNVGITGLSETDLNDLSEGDDNQTFDVLIDKTAPSLDGEESGVRFIETLANGDVIESTRLVDTSMKAVKIKVGEEWKTVARFYGTIKGISKGELREDYKGIVAIWGDIPCVTLGIKGLLMVDDREGVVVDGDNYAENKYIDLIRTEGINNVSFYEKDDKSGLDIFISTPYHFATVPCCEFVEEKNRLNFKSIDFEIVEGRVLSKGLSSGNGRFDNFDGLFYIKDNKIAVVNGLENAMPDNISGEIFYINSYKKSVGGGIVIEGRNIKISGKEKRGFQEAQIGIKLGSTEIPLRFSRIIDGEVLGDIEFIAEVDRFYTVKGDITVVKDGLETRYPNGISVGWYSGDDWDYIIEPLEDGCIINTTVDVGVLRIEEEENREIREFIENENVSSGNGAPIVASIRRAYQEVYAGELKSVDTSIVGRKRKGAAFIARVAPRREVSSADKAPSTIWTTTIASRIVTVPFSVPKDFISSKVKLDWSEFNEPVTEGAKFNVWIKKDVFENAPSSRVMNDYRILTGEVRELDGYVLIGTIDATSVKKNTTIKIPGGLTGTCATILLSAYVSGDGIKPESGEEITIGVGTLSGSFGLSEGWLPNVSLV